jgi:hypothetical protein
MRYQPGWVKRRRVEGVMPVRGEFAAGSTSGVAECRISNKELQMMKE